MRETTIKDTFNAGARMAQNIAASKEAVTDALQEGKETMTAFIKQTRHAAEDWMDEATHNIKRFPVGSVVMAFSLGALFGVLISKNGRS